MSWWSRKRREDDLARELHSHIELEAEERQADGLAPDDARYAAQRAFGNLTRTKENTRAVWSGMFFERLWQDVRFSVRAMRRYPGATITALVTLALGTGANTAIFSIVNTVLIKPLPYRDADRLMRVWSSNRIRGDTEQVSSLDFADWKAQNHVFDEVAASTDVLYTLTGAGEPASVIGYRFSSNFFHVLGVEPLLGRTFRAEEQQPGKDRVVVLGYRLWQSRFGGDRSLVGQTIRLDGAPYTVIGIMPRGVDYPGSVELWTPLVIPPEAANDRSYRFLRVLGRLKAGVTATQARNEMNQIARRLAREYPKTNQQLDTASMLSVRENISGGIRPALFVLMCAVALVLLIACANIANLLLVRAVARRKEVAVRTALGAARSRLVRQFLTESLLLSVLGGAGGLLLALEGSKALVALFPPTIANLNIPRIDHIPLDARVLAFALFASLLTGILLGVIPALEAARTDTNDSLKDSSRASTGSASGRRLRNTLVTTEVALSLLLLAAACLTIKSFAQLVRGDLGFNPRSVLTVRVILPSSKYPTDPKQAAFGNEAVRRIQSLPGVSAAGTVTFLPLSGWWGTRPISIPGKQDLHEPMAIWSSVTPDYFRAMGIPLIAGRVFDAHDTGGGMPVAIVSRALARQLDPDGSAIGIRLNIGEKSPVQVVGVVGNVHQLGMTSELVSEIYLPFSQIPAPILCFAIRTAGDPMRLANAVRQQIWGIDKDQAVSYLMSMADLASESLAPERVVSLLLGSFAAMALTMAVMGIYGVISFAAAQRTREIGVRIAVGASYRHVLTLIAGQALAPVIVGLMLGLAAAFATMRFLSSVLYGVRPVDPVIFAAVPMAMLLSAIVASYVPARRAAKLDPVIALRDE